MKRAIGMAVANWLRKPENREKVKRTARQLWTRYQGQKSARDSDRRNPPR
ncbi:MAG: hypothetical protein UMU75_06625 [Halomonas sp.]|nr:hypothetical protein [Halomonas sp.]